LGGVARRATAIEQERAKGGSVLVLDAGNGLSGDRDPAKRTEGATSITAMNMIGYDAAALGPNDLKLGPIALRQRINEAQFPIVSANAVMSNTDELLTIPYVLLRFGGHRIAVAGLTGGDGTSEISVRDPLGTARAILPEIEIQADVIILLSTAGQEINLQIAELRQGVDVIISGGPSQLATPLRAESTSTLILPGDHSSPGHAGRRIGIARLGFGAKGQLLTHRWERLELGPEFARDPALASWVAKQITP
jgi:2',3'-cyclic-nucleotide 2'-phosphodiesterase (5'-nucleotidase family)